jgi:DNA-directed RNA polymerase specialized sigma24 family protein
VLRYWEGLSETEAAEVLGCSVGTVKSAASRGMVRLRDIHADTDDQRVRAQPREEIR